MIEVGQRIGWCWFLVCGGLLLSAASWAVPLAGPGTTTAGDRASNSLTNGVATFDAVWRIINETHYDPKFNGVDWNAVRTELRPKAEAARTPRELRPIITGMLDRLKVSHMAILPREAVDAAPREGEDADHETESGAEDQRDRRNPVPPLGFGHAGQQLLSLLSATPSARRIKPALVSINRPGDLGLDLRRIGPQFVVSRLEANGPAAKAGVKLGWVLEAIGDERVSDFLNWEGDRPQDRTGLMAWARVAARLRGRAGSRVRLVFLNGANRRVALKLKRADLPGQRVKLGHLPAMYARFSEQRLEPQRGLEVGLIQFNLWMVPLAPAFDAAIDALRGCDGIVLDLRGNVGGVMGMLMGISGHFLQQRVALGTVKMRTADLQIMSNPRLVSATGQRVQPFAGPLAILVDEVSVSASEIFAGGMQAIGRARVFGRTTPGQAVPAVFDRLPNGDVLLHVLGDFVTAKGVRLEGRGVVPDEPVPLRREDLLARRDAVLAAALRWIAAEKKHPQASALAAHTAALKSITQP